MAGTRKLRCAVMAGVMFGGLAMLHTLDRPYARPQYLKAFSKKYPGMVVKAKATRCGVCHFGKRKKNRNDYGKAFAKHLVGAPKAPAVINAALRKTEKDKNAKGQTFGSLIEAGKLPGSKPKGGRVKLR